jgi:hypothetical protein
MAGPGEKQHRDHLLAWACFACFRYLRFGHPLKAEQEFVQEIYRDHLWNEMTAAGQIPEGGTHNVVRKSAWGHTKRTTIMAEQGAGRTWPSDIPPEFAGYPTIHVPDVKLGSTHIVGHIISALSRPLPAELAEAHRKLLADIEAESNPPLAVSDRDAFAQHPASEFVPLLLGQQAAALMDLFDRMAPLYESPGTADPAVAREYWHDISHRYGLCLLDAHHYSALLVVLEVIRAAHPVWPLGSGFPRFVCGRLECRHRLCQLHRQAIYESTPLPAILGAGLGARDLWSYFANNRITKESFLDDVLQASAGRQWLRHAAEFLRQSSKVLWDSLAGAHSVTNFYHIHFLNGGFTHAAELAYEKLKVTASSAEDRSSCEYLAKEMDESLARSGNALLFDLRNSIAQCLSDPGSAGILDSMGPAAVDYLSKGGIANYRAVYQQTAQRSENTAELNLDKWLYNEALFPVFWEDYIRGRVPTLPDAPSKTSTPLAQTK